MSSAFVDVDLHGLTADQAQMEIDRVLRRLSPQSTRFGSSTATTAAPPSAV